ncbi:MAG TPA: hypothetical protein VGC28_06720 [Sphingomonas sp.]
MTESAGTSQSFAIRKHRRKHRAIWRAPLFAFPIALITQAASGVTPADPAPLAGQIAPSDEMKPFVVDHFQRTDSDADARFLHDGPAGAQGYIKAHDGHLYLPSGKRFRCWGVNLTGWTPGSSEIAPKEEGKVFAAELARLGVNCVRLHFLDMPDKTEVRDETGPTGDPEPLTHKPAGLIDSSRNDTSHFNPEQLDRLDYFFAQLKANGIYSDINLNVGHTWKAGDGIPDAKLIGVAKAYTYFGPELIAKEKDYAKQLLDHYNPYTRTRYADDPAVVIVEMVNENSLLEFWMRNWFRGELGTGAPSHQLDLTPHYLALLTGMYNDWLRHTMTATELADLHRLAGVPEGQPMTFTRRGDFDAVPKPVFDAEVAFITHVEQSYFADMSAYLRNDLGVKANIVATADHTYFIPGQPLLRTTQRYDINDAHVYWQHPAIYGLRNTPMVNDPLHSIIQKLSRTAIADHPFTVSEVNEPFPHEYDSEQIPILAAYAALQDWDGIFFYTWETKEKGQWQPVVGDHFDMTEHPAKVAQMPVGAMMFLRGDVAPARQTVVRSYSADQINAMMKMPPSALPSYTPGYPAALPLVHGTRIGCLDCKPVAAPPVPSDGPIVSDTGQLSWRTHDNQDGLVTIDTPRSQALVGFIKANGVSVTNLAADISNRFATITLSSLDGKPLGLSGRMLLTTTGKVQNTGSEWNARRTLYAKWGTAPTLIEPIRGWIQLKDLIGAVDVTATPLDGSARPLGTIKGRLLETGWEIPIGDTPTTTYLITVAR